MIKILPDQGITAPLGFMASGVMAGVRRQDKKDVAVVFSQVPAIGAAVYTTNKFQAAPLEVTQDNLKDGRLQAVVINSGVANACMGQQGLSDAAQMADLTAQYLDLDASEVAVASTGVIGMPLPMDKIEQGIFQAVQNLSSAGGVSAAEAIMTTDTKCKQIAAEVEIEGQKVTIGAMAKGSGMIHPNMATMLAFITTDAHIALECLQEVIQQCTEQSFNMVSVDGDTSTNDMLLMMANGRAGNEIINKNSPSREIFQSAVLEICIILAKMIAADGEGATKLIEIQVRGARSLAEARQGARAISASNLVKAAVFGADANWGRIVTALGYAGIEVDPSLVDVFMGDLMMAQKGSGLNFDEQLAKDILNQQEIRIVVDLHLGEYQAFAWGCDLTFDYVKINADYRT